MPGVISFGMEQILRYLRRLERYRNRKRLMNRSFSLISNNCIGGIISHDMHLRFLSPTVNLSFANDGFLLFCRHLDYYLSIPVEEVVSDKGYPVGVLKGDYGDIFLYFMHYGSFPEAKQKWEERASRVDMENLFIVMEAQKCDESVLRRFDELEFPNKVILTDGYHPGIGCSFPVKDGFYDEDYFNGKILSYPKFGLRRYLDSFDYVSFFNKGVIRKRRLL